MWPIGVGAIPQYYHYCPRCYFYEDSMLFVPPAFFFIVQLCKVLSCYRGMIVTSGKVVIKKDETNLIGISIGGGAPYCPCLYIVQVECLPPNFSVTFWRLSLCWFIAGIRWNASIQRRYITKWRWTSCSQWRFGKGKNKSFGRENGSSPNKKCFPFSDHFKHFHPLDSSNDWGSDNQLQ